MKLLKQRISSENDLLKIIDPLKLRKDLNAEKIMEDILLEEEEAKEKRLEETDWTFIFNQPQKLAYALIELVKDGDLLRCAKIAEMSPLEFDKIRVKAKIYHL
jgi:hypothetical protein